MPIQGNGMHNPTKQPDPPKAPEAKGPVDPITAAVTAAIGKTETTVNAAAKEKAKPPEDKPVGDSDAGVVFDPELPRDELERQMIARIRPPEKAPYVPPPPNERMQTQLDIEQEAGRKRVALARQQFLNRPKPKPDPTAGTNVEVRRDGSYQHEANVNKATSI
jgi:hypothetical protein